MQANERLELLVIHEDLCHGRTFRVATGLRHRCVCQIVHVWPWLRFRPTPTQCMCQLRNCLFPLLLPSQRRFLLLLLPVLLDFVLNVGLQLPLFALCLQLLRLLQLLLHVHLHNLKRVHALLLARAPCIPSLPRHPLLLIRLTLPLQLMHTPKGGREGPRCGTEPVFWGGRRRAHEGRGLVGAFHGIPCVFLVLGLVGGLVEQPVQQLGQGPGHRGCDDHQQHGEARASLGDGQGMPCAQGLRQDLPKQKHASDADDHCCQRVYQRV
mmetsp:Transcript_2957/g.7717  ORF Transcript_2957/g.7717 Transcript_2957/m.7717 type:complete len:267 (+) Transcript_2957:2473-3273(+)